MKTLFPLFLVILCSACATPHPKCDSPNNWAATVAFVHLKNAKLTTDISSREVTRIASEKIGENLFQQVHLVEFSKTDGTKIEVITTNHASNEECSMSEVSVYIVETKLGG